ncbi:MAG: sialate O-acetylesterase, partial [Hyphomicrobiaceae bacterium]
FAVTVLAQGGTSAADWSLGGKCHRLLEAAIPAIRKAPPVTHIVYHQGERDTFLKTARAAYVASFRSLAARLAHEWPAAPILLCTASYRMGVTSQEVRAAQAELVATMAGCRPGPDTDSLGADMRRDDTHFNAAGLEAFAAMLAALLP